MAMAVAIIAAVDGMELVASPGAKSENHTPGTITRIKAIKLNKIKTKSSV
jgi:hypothetical protein